MSAHDELNKALVELSNAAAGVRDQLMHLPPQSSHNSECVLSVNSHNSVACIHEVNAQDVLRFESGKEDIEVERLLRIIANASEASKRIGAYVQYSEPANDVNPTHKVPKSAAMGYSSKLRDSLGSLCELMGGEATNNRFYEEQPARTIQDCINDAGKLTLAFVYQRLKTLKSNLSKELAANGINGIADQIDELMDEIKERSVTTNGH